MDTVNVKRAILISLFIIAINNCYSQYATLVNIGSIENKFIKAKMDKNATKLLSEINYSFAKGTVPSLSGIEMTTNAKSRLLALWETSPFRCKETEIIDNILINGPDKMELRNILLFMKKANSSDQNTEARIEFTNSGIIDDFLLTIDYNQWITVRQEGTDVKDLRRREIILNFVENFKTAYNRKDTSFLNKVFSEYALIIVGKVIEVKLTDGDYRAPKLLRQMVYTISNKTTYLQKLQNIFDANSYMNIDFKELRVVQHDIKPDIYGVSFWQSWDTPGYKDKGYVFLLLDFKNEDNPIIHVRTWQPNVGEDGRKIRSDELIDIGSFGNIQ